jgi:hypothetical protein
MNNFYIYSHIRKTDGKCFYIGKGKGNRYKNIIGRNQYWHNVVNKYGFETKILVNNISEEKAFELESYFCEQIGYENLCNLRKENGWGGWSHTEESKLKQSLAMSGKTHTQETKNKISLSKKGQANTLGKTWKYKHPRTQENKDKISKTLSGKPKSKTHIENMKQPRSEEIKEKLRLCKYKYNLEQYDLQGNFIKLWPNPTTAIKELGIKGIFENLKGRSKTAGDFIWKYATKDLAPQI